MLSRLCEVGGWQVMPRVGVLSQGHAWRRYAVDFRMRLNLVKPCKDLQPVLVKIVNRAAKNNA